MNESLGFAHFLSQADAVGRGVLFLLLSLSVASWYLIVTKSLANVLAGRRAAAFLRRFWEARLDRLDAYVKVLQAKEKQSNARKQDKRR